MDRDAPFAWPDAGLQPETVLTRFEACVAAQPQALAVVDEQGRWTYAALAARADAIAARLQAAGVQPEQAVGVLMQRRAELPAVLLGIWKAGAAYLPLDPQEPPDRLRRLLAGGDCACVVGDAPLLDGLQAGGVDGDAATLRTVDLADPDIDGARPRPCPPEGSRLAYLLFTSGSTGQPKAVEVEHRQVLALLDSARELLGYRPADRTLAASTIAFDASVTELFLPLVCGASLLLRDRAVLLDPRRLARDVHEHAVTVLATGPAVWAVVLAEVPDFPRLRVLITHGEAVSPALARRLCAHGDQVWNLYGPTETTVWATGCALTAALDCSLTPSSAPIGRPLAHVQALVVDPQGRPLADGHEGELCLGGPAVARGYRGHDALTRERFVTIDGRRVYRTGDLVLRDADGSLHYLGRNDDQMKVRGVRVEPGEVEAALLQDPRVARAAVTWYPTATGTRAIAAAVVLKPGVACQGEQLRQALATRLPRTMIPARYLLVPWLPTTLSGKIDRQALRDAASAAPDEPAVDTAIATRAPRALPLTATEAAVAAIWQRMLGLASVDRDDHFFAIGGDSLAAVQMMVEAEAACGLLLPVHLAFEAPTLSALCRRIDALRPAGRGGWFARTAAALGGRLLRPLPQPQPQPQPPVEAERPLSLVQRRLWLLERLLPDRAAYNVHWCWRLHGPLDVPALARALDALVARHETLRTRYGLQGDEPVQRIAPPRPLAWPVQDLSAVARDEVEQQASAQMQAHAREPFDLEAGAPLRVQLLRLGAQEHLLQFCIHHIAADGWSLAVFARDLSLAYEAALQGRAPGWAPLAMQYADLAQQQRQQLAGPAMAASLAYWTRRLADLPTLALPADRPRPPLASHRGARVRVSVSPALGPALRQLARDEGATLFMVLLAAFKVLLARYSGQHDIVVGTPLAGRSHAESRALIGFFVNTVVLRTDLAGNPPWRTLLGRVQQTVGEAFAHQDLPFERLVEALAPARDLAREPLFQVLFALQNTPQAELQLPGIRATPLDLEVDNAKFDLGVFVRDAADGLRVDWVYASDLFDAATVQRMADNFVLLLEDIVADPGGCIDALVRPGAAERALLLQLAGAAAAPAVDTRGLHQRVQDQAARTPQALALVAGSTTWTYAQLDRQANRLAQQLRALGVGPEDRVGICLERSADLVAALLAVLKAGAAYVPLEPTQPAPRLALMEQDAAPVLVLTSRTCIGRLPPHGAPRWCLDEHAESLARQPDTPPGAPDAAGARLAYVLFTSGSSGRPKGVAVEHRNAVALLQWAGRVFDATELAGTLCSTSIGFDLSVFEIFAPLSVGGAVILASDGLQWTGQPGAERVTLVNTVPSVLQALLQTQRLPPSVRTVNLAGEALPESLVARLFALPQVRRVCNLYGPTECTTYSTWADLDRTEGGAPPIGRPVDGTRVHVLDAGQAPVPLGAPGELVLGGAGVARGYLGPASDALNDRFAPDPFDPGPGARWYRTGDRVRQRADGRLLYLGRLDQQVKIHGVRTEPGEIEAVLGRHPQVQQGVVIAREDQPGDRRLVAYVVPTEAMPDPGDALRQTLVQHLRGHLPEAWCPADWVWLPQLPLTPHGKVDRRALPAPTANRGLAATATGPRDAIEATLLAIWRDLLAAGPIGVHDNFFDLGGHSLLAVRLFARLEDAGFAPQPLALLFRAPTVATLAQALRERRESGGLVPLRRSGAQPPLFAVAPGDGDLMTYRTLVRHLGPGQPIFGVPLDGLAEQAASPQLVEQLAARRLHELRQSHPHGPYRLLGACFGALVAVEMARQLLQAGETVAMLALVHPASPRPRPDGARPSRLAPALRDRLDLARFLARRWQLYRRQWQGLRGDDRRAFVRAKLGALRRAGRQPGAWLAGHHELQAHRLHQASLQALQRHHAAGLPAAAPLVHIACAASRQDQVHADWSTLLPGGLQVRPVDGESLAEMLSDEHAAALAGWLATCLQAAR